jgi:CubicO group peptidase (beta-lactamase class C family)
MRRYKKYRMRELSMRISSIAKAIVAALWLLIAASVPLNVASAAYTVTGGPGPAPINATTPNADYAQLDSVMTQFMLKANVPNAQLAVGYGGRIIYVRGYTASTTERPLQTITATINAVSRTYAEPAYVTTQPNTRFRVASLSKLVTGLALQQLVLDGKVSMTESAYSILREDPTATSLAAFTAAPVDLKMLNVQVKHLVNHEAGIARGAPLASPVGQPQDIIDYADPPGTVKPWPYPYNVANTTEFVKSCKRHLEVDLPRRRLHYSPGSPPLVLGAYYQSYTNIAYCWAERVIEIRSGMAYEDYVRSKVLAPLGIEKPRLANQDVMARWFTGDSANAEINAYYDQPFASSPNATLAPNWCALYEGTPAPPGCVGPRPNSYSARDYGGSGGWVFSAQEYLRMLQSAKSRLRAPHLLDFPASNVSGSDSLFAGPLLGSGTAGADTYRTRYSFGASANEWRVTATNALLGYYTQHTGSLPGSRSYYASDDITPMNWVVTLNTQPDADNLNCSSASTVPDATKYWCLLQGVRVSENNGANFTSTSGSNSIFHQLRAMYGNSGKLATMMSAADLWVDQTPLPCDLDVNGAGNGVKNGVADGLMILRAMNGLRGAATTSFDRAEKNARDLVSTRVVDMDGDGTVNPAIDGVILIRALLGLKDGAVTADLTIPGPRNDWNAIRSYLNTSCAAALP